MHKILLGSCLVFISLFAYLYWQRTKPLTSVTSNSPVVRLTLPELEIDTPVIATKLNGINWEYTSKGAAYLSSTPLPGAVGNTVFYGHNWPNIFGKLIHAQPGQKIITTFADGTQKTFLINTTAVVGKYHTEILHPTTDIRLTLFTCTGFLDRDRFVATAIPL